MRNILLIYKKQINRFNTGNTILNNYLIYNSTDHKTLNDKQLKAQNKKISKTITDNILLSNMLNENLISNI